MALTAKQRADWIRAGLGIPSNAIAPILLTPKQYAALIGRNPDEVRKDCCSGAIPGAFRQTTRDGQALGRWRIPIAALDPYIH